MKEDHSPDSSGLTKSDERPEEHSERPLVAESLESRILYSGSPIGAELPDVSIEDSQTLADEVAQERFLPVDQDYDGSQVAASNLEFDDAETALLTSFDNLTPREIARLAETTVDCWKGAKDLSPEQSEAIEALEVAITHFDGLESDSGSGLQVELSEDGGGTYYDLGLLSDDFDFGDLESSGMAEIGYEADGAQIINELIEEVAQPEPLQRMIEDLVAVRTVEIEGDQIPITYDTLDQLIEAAEHRSDSVATDQQIAGPEPSEVWIPELLARKNLSTLPDESSEAS